MKICCGWEEERGEISRAKNVEGACACTRTRAAKTFKGDERREDCYGRRRVEFDGVSYSRRSGVQKTRRFILKSLRDGIFNNGCASV